MNRTKLSSAPQRFCYRVHRVHGRVYRALTKVGCWLSVELAHVNQIHPVVTPNGPNHTLPCPTRTPHGRTDGRGVARLRSQECKRQRAHVAPSPLHNRSASVVRLSMNEEEKCPLSLPCLAPNGLREGGRASDLRKPSSWKSHKCPHTQKTISIPTVMHCTPSLPSSREGGRRETNESPPKIPTLSVGTSMTRPAAAVDSGSSQVVHEISAICRGAP